MDQSKTRFIKEMTQVGGVAVSIVESETYGAAGLDHADENVVEDPWRTEEILENIASERLRQDEKWGQQSHSPAKWTAILMEEVGEAAAEVEPEEGLLGDLVTEIKELGLRVREALNDGSI